MFMGYGDNYNRVVYCPIPVKKITFCVKKKLTHVQPAGIVINNNIRMAK